MASLTSIPPALDAVHSEDGRAYASSLEHRVLTPPVGSAPGVGSLRGATSALSFTSLLDDSLRETIPDSFCTVDGSPHQGLSPMYQYRKQLRKEKEQFESELRQLREHEELEQQRRKQLEEEEDRLEQEELNRLLSDFDSQLRNSKDDGVRRSQGHDYWDTYTAELRKKQSKWNEEDKARTKHSTHNAIAVPVRKDEGEECMVSLTDAPLGRGPSFALPTHVKQLGPVDSTVLHSTELPRGSQSTSDTLPPRSPQSPEPSPPLSPRSPLGLTAVTRKSLPISIRHVDSSHWGEFIDVHAVFRPTNEQEETFRTLKEDKSHCLSDFRIMQTVFCKKTLEKSSKGCTAYQHTVDMFGIGKLRYSDVQQAIETKAFYYWHHARSKESYPILFFHPKALEDSREKLRDELLFRALFGVLEGLIESDMQASKEGAVLVVDMEDAGAFHLLGLARSVLELLVDKYPLRLKRILVLKASSFMTLALRGLRQFLSPKIRERVTFLDRVESLQDWISADSLPHRYGGDRALDYHDFRKDLLARLLPE